MRKITEQALEHFSIKQEWKSGADSVVFDLDGNVIKYRLYNTDIVVMGYKPGTKVMAQGMPCDIAINFPPEWCTATTAERLNGFAQYYGFGRVSRVNGEWRLNGKPVSGWQAKA